MCVEVVETGPNIGAVAVGSRVPAGVEALGGVVGGPPPPLMTTTPNTGLEIPPTVHTGGNISCGSGAGKTLVISTLVPICFGLWNDLVSTASTDGREGDRISCASRTG